MMEEWLAVADGLGDRAAIVHEDEQPRRTTTWAELAGLVRGGRAALRALGLPRACLPLLARRSAESIAVMLAIVLEGGAFSWLHPRSSPGQILHAARATGGDLLVDAEHARVLSRAAEQVPGVRVFSLKRAGSGVLAVRAASPGAGAPESPPVALPGGTACILFTSGSTGVPKGVMISAADLSARARTEIDCFRLTPEDALLCLLPFSFDVGLNQMLSGLLSGARLHISDRWMRTSLLAVMQRAGITAISAVPSVWSLAMAGLPDGEPILGTDPTLRYVTVSGGSLPAAALARLSSLLPGGTAIHKTYGQTETFRSAISIDATAPANQASSASVGRPVPGCRIHIARDRAALARTGEVGEVLHVGDGTMIGYLGDPELTSQKLGRHVALGEATVVFTGDLGYLGEDGHLYLAGRRDTMIKSNGFRVYPGEVEEALARCPGVHEAVVFGVPHELQGERIIAVLTGAPDLDPADVRLFLSGELAPYMIPGEIVVWPSLPRTGSGKPALAQIRETFLEPG